MMNRDKVKPIKKITDEDTLISLNESDLTQCPYCKRLYNINTYHICDIKKDLSDWMVCSICSIGLHKKPKKVVMSNGRSYTSTRSKKYIRIISSLICWNCAMKITHEIKQYIKKGKR